MQGYDSTCFVAISYKCEKCNPRVCIGVMGSNVQRENLLNFRPLVSYWCPYCSIMAALQHRESLHDAIMPAHKTSYDTEVESRQHRRRNTVEHHDGIARNIWRNFVRLKFM